MYPNVSLYNKSVFVCFLSILFVLMCITSSYDTDQIEYLLVQFVFGPWEET